MPLTHCNPSLLSGHRSLGVYCARTRTGHGRREDAGFEGACRNTTGASGESFPGDMQLSLALRIQTRGDVKLCFLSPTLPRRFTASRGHAHVKKKHQPSRPPALTPLFRTRAVPVQITKLRGSGTLEEAPTRSGCIILLSSLSLSNNRKEW